MSGRRLLFVTDSFQVGGAERTLVGLAAGLVARGAQVAVACSVGGALAVDAARAGVAVRVVGRRLVKRRVDEDFGHALHLLIAEDPPDLIHTHMFASTTAAAQAIRGTATPLVVHEHSEAAWRDRAARTAAAVAYRRSAAVIAVSQSIRRRLLEVDRLPPAKVHLVPNALPWGPKPTLRTRLARPDDGPLVGVIARLQPEKGVEVFLRAASRLAPHFPSASFVVVGDGPERGPLERLAMCLGLPVLFAGFRPDGPALLGELDLLVVPSFSEGTPLVVLEAAAAGVPVVASAVGGIPEQVCDGLEALLVPPGDDEALAAACARVLGDACFGARLTDAARRRLERDARPEAVLDAVESIYDRVLGANRLPVDGP
jgi:glycosyltransferase involved in cell wall biosynthesis